MGYKDTQKQKEANRIASQRRRDKQKGMTEGMTKESMTQEGMTQYPAILYALTDPAKRLKLEKIYQSLKNRNLDKLVFYGYPVPYMCDGKRRPAGQPFDVVGDLLEATRKGA